MQPALAANAPFGQAPAAGGPPAGQAIATFTVESQLQAYWCWAAVGSSVADVFGTAGWSQCTIATAEFAPNGWACCGADAADTARCNQAWHLDLALERVGHFDRMTGAATAFTDIQAEVGAGRPLGCRIAWAGSGAHFVAIGGWSIDSSGVQYLDIEDPYLGLVQKTYPDFCSAYQGSGDRWTHSYFTRAFAAASAAGGGVSVGSPKNA